MKDLDFERAEILVRQGKGGKDRVTVFPTRVRAALQIHLARVKALHARDLARGAGEVVLPGALDRKLPGASREWAWQWVFPPRGATWREARGSAVDIIWTRRCCSARFETPRGGPGFRSG